MPDVGGDNVSVPILEETQVNDDTLFDALIATNNDVEYIVDDKFVVILVSLPPWSLVIAPETLKLHRG